MGRKQQINPRWEYDITEYVGKRLAVTFEVYDEDDNIVPLTGYTASGLVVDEDGATVITLTPSIVAATGLVVLDQTLSALLTPGRLDWFIILIDASGYEHVRFVGKFHLKSLT